MSQLTNILSYYTRFRRAIHLTFDKDLEMRFQKDYTEKHISIVRLGIILTIVLFSLFGIDDIWMAPHSKKIIWFIRYAIICPYFIILYRVTYTNWFRKHMNPIVMISQLVSGVCLVLFIDVLDKGELGIFYYYAGIILVIYGNFTLTGLRFLSASLVSIMTIVFFEYVYIFVHHMLSAGQVDNISFIIFFNDNSFLLSVLLISMVSGYILEQYKRRDFLQRIEIETKTEELLKKNLTLQTFSYVDSLTNVPNRRSFNERFNEEWYDAQRKGHNLSMLMLDIDEFKKYNDYYGHQQGDQCLIEIAKALSSCLHRPKDFMARYGGEEFAMILPETDENGILTIGELIKDKLKASAIPHPTSKYGYVTISIGGVSYYPKPNMEPNEMIEKADQALYESKLHGRNTMTIVN